MKRVVSVALLVFVGQGCALVESIDDPVLNGSDGSIGEDSSSDASTPTVDGFADGLENDGPADTELAEDAEADSGIGDASGEDAEVADAADDDAFVDSMADAGEEDAGDASDDAPDDAVVDPCAGITCNKPPSATCANATTRRTYAASGTCSGGACSYAATDTTCNTPPGATCASSTTRRTYAASGTCSGGTCSYAATDKICNTPPSATCASSTARRTYSASGTCSGGTCSYASTDVPCSTPPSATCADPATKRTYASSGTCSTGTCNYATTDTPCGSGNACSAGVCGPPPSCAGGLTCGSGASCCESKLVPGGSFPMGRGYTCPSWADSGCSSNELPENIRSVSSFRLDTFEVTVGRFRKFVAAYPASKPAAGDGAHPLIAGSGWQSAWNGSLPADQAALITSLKCPQQTYTTSAGADEDKPILCVNWFVAFAFCAWDGGRLPTETEWEYAAAGGSEDRIVPWGSSAPDASHAAYFDTAGLTGAAAVGAHPAGQSRWGQQDMAGNASEWVLDWFTAYGGSPGPDYANVASGSTRVTRGGSWQSSASAIRAASRVSAAPTVGPGVRCARNP